MIVVLLNADAIAYADSLSAGVTAFQHGDYIRAADKLGRPAQRGNARAEALLGYMYANGLGTPQSYPLAVDLLEHSAERGNPTAQYFLGLMYDKGQGVIQDDVIAYKWLSLAASNAAQRERDYYARLRNAVASKMTPAQIAVGQSLASGWFPRSRF